MGADQREDRVPGRLELPEDAGRVGGRRVGGTRGVGCGLFLVQRTGSERGGLHRGRLDDTSGGPGSGRPDASGSCRMRRRGRRGRLRAMPDCPSPAATRPPDPACRAACDRHRADGRRDRRHQQRRPRPLARRPRRHRHADREPAGRPGRRRRCDADRARAGGPGGHDRRPGTHPGRPHPRGRRRGLRRDRDGGSGRPRVAPGDVGAPGPPVPVHQRQAGLDHPVGHAACRTPTGPHPAGGWTGRTGA